jgi:site-specific recombinase XerD
LLEGLRQDQEGAKGPVFGATPEEVMKKRLRRELMRASKKCSFPDVTKLHTTRHTFASQLVMAGESLETVAKLLGHADLETTRIYAHLSPDYLKRAVEKLDF